MPAPASGASAAAGAYSGRAPIKLPRHCPPSEHEVTCELDTCHGSRASPNLPSRSAAHACCLVPLRKRSLLPFCTTLRISRATNHAIRHRHLLIRDHQNGGNTD